MEMIKISAIPKARIIIKPPHTTVFDDITEGHFILNSNVKSGAEIAKLCLTQVSP